jgi:hypothetical protein
MAAALRGVMMRLSAALIFTLVIAAVWPLAAAETLPLPPGKPAGVAQAQMNNHQLFIYITIGGTIATVTAGLLLLKKTKAAATPTTTIPASAAAALGASLGTATTTTS